MRQRYLPSTDTALGLWTAGFASNVAMLASSIGISSGQSAALDAVNAKWLDALAAAKAEATRSRPTIVAKDSAKKEMLALVRQLVGIIQKHPGTTNEMRAKLGITVARRPSPTPAPPAPFGFRFTLNSIGGIDLTWKNRDAEGCFYLILRRLDGAGEYKRIAAVGRKKYSDNTVPAGTAKVEYRLQAVRSTGQSDWTTFDVNFGTTRATHTAAMKLLDAA